MRALPAALSARWRSIVSTGLDRVADACLATSLRCMALRDRVQPAEAPAVPNADAILSAVLTRIQEPVYQPDADDIAAALLTHATGRTVWIQRTPNGTRAAVCGDHY